MRKAVNQPVTPGPSVKWLLAVSSAILVLAFFIPWVAWDKSRITGADMPLGHFFGISAGNFQLGNPFPQFSFALQVFWLVPLLGVITLVAALSGKRSSFTSAVAGITALTAATVYILFSRVLADLGIHYTLQIGIYLTIASAAGIILAGVPRWPAKILFLVIGPALAWLGFYAGSSFLENEKFEDTANTPAAYTVNVIDMIREFQANDSLANAKYREKIITVNGRITALELPNDSTVNIKFTDTTGSYAIFPFHGEAVNEVRGLKEGDSVSIKGSCSGGVLSEILGTESITFKRCTLNK